MLDGALSALHPAGHEQLHLILAIRQERQVYRAQFTSGDPL